MKLISASWCGGCQKAKELVKDNNLPVEVISLDDNPEVQQELRVRSLPSLFDDNDTLLAVGSMPVIQELNKLKG